MDISFVIPCYNVSEYLDDFLSSLERQKEVWRDEEFIFVNDGSTDNTLEIITEWFDRWDLKGKVINKTNGGLSTARNVGIKEATGKWITFPDPDDYLSDNYIEELSKSLKNDVDIISCRMICFNEKGQFSHPLDWKFKHGNRIVNMNKEPHYIQLAHNSCLLKLSVLKENGIYNHENVKPSFEDAHTICRYLLRTDCRMYLQSNVVYYYRKRANSLVGSSWTKKEKYNEQIVNGYLDILKRGNTLWLKNVVLYDLFWYVDYGSRNRVSEENSKSFFRNMKKISLYIPISLVKDYKSSSAGSKYRYKMITLLKGNKVLLFGRNSSSLEERIKALKL